MNEGTTKTELKAKINRGMTGNYGWEVSVMSGTLTEEGVRALLKKIDAGLIKDYIEQEGGDEDED